MRRKLPPCDTVIELCAPVRSSIRLMPRSTVAGASAGTRTVSEIGVSGSAKRRRTGAGAARVVGPARRSRASSRPSAPVTSQLGEASPIRDVICRLCHDAQCGGGEGRVGGEIESQFLSGLSLRPQLEVVVHIVDPQIALLVGDHKADAGQVEQAIVRHAAQLFAQAAIRHHQLGREEETLQLDITTKRQQAAVIAIYRREVVKQREIRRDDLHLFGRTHQPLYRVRRQAAGLAGAQFCQIAGVEANVREAQETVATSRRLILRGGEQGSRRVAQTCRGGGRRQGERQRPRAQPQLNKGQRHQAAAGKPGPTSRRPEQPGHCAPRDRPARQRQPLRALLDDNQRGEQQDRQRNCRTFAPTPRSPCPLVPVSPCRRVPVSPRPRVSVPPCLRGRRQHVQPERSQCSHAQRKQLQPACRRTEQVEAGDHAPQQIVERVVCAQGEQEPRCCQQRRALHVPRGPLHRGISPPQQ